MIPDSSYVGHEKSLRCAHNFISFDKKQYYLAYADFPFIRFTMETIFECFYLHNSLGQKELDTRLRLSTKFSRPHKTALLKTSSVSPTVCFKHCILKQTESPSRPSWVYFSVVWWMCMSKTYCIIIINLGSIWLPDLIRFRDHECGSYYTFIIPAVWCCPY